MAAETTPYPATLEIDYTEKLNRLTTFFRVFWAVPVFILLALLTGGDGGGHMLQSNAHETTSSSSGWGSIVTGLSVATGLMILFRQRYPRWWFDFNLELNRFSTRVGAYLALLTDQYPSTVEAQAVHLDLVYPDAEKDLNRWLPLVKWLLAVPHYLVLLVLVIAAGFTTIIAWFAILFTGRYPKSLFDFAVGVGRWNWRVNAYALLLTTDQYPPFSLK